MNIADDTMYRDASVEDETAAEAWVSAKYLFDNYFAAGQQYESMQAQYLYTASVADAATWDEVGFKKVDDYTVDFILANPVNEANFYVPYNLSSSTWSTSPFTKPARPSTRTARKLPPRKKRTK